MSGTNPDTLRDAATSRSRHGACTGRDDQPFRDAVITVPVVIILRAALINPLLKEPRREYLISRRINASNFNGYPNRSG